MNQRRAFTLVDVIVVIAILLVLAVFLQPVFITVREAAKVTITKSNLRQLGQAVAMYRSTNGGDGIYGDANVMSLPHFDAEFPVYSELESPANSHPSARKLYGPLYKKLYGTAGGIVSDQWPAYARVAQEQSVVFIDPYFNSHQVDLMFPGFNELRLIAVRLDTSIVDIREVGEWELPVFWRELYQRSHPD